MALQEEKQQIVPEDVGKHGILGYNFILNYTKQNLKNLLVAIVNCSFC